MIIISFPVPAINYSHDIQTFLDLGFKIIDNGHEGSYIKLPEGWLGTYQYHTPFEFFIIIRDANRRIRAYATLLGNTSYVELLNRYKIVNYKPWLSPHNSELRLIDNETGNIIFSQSYYPQWVSNNNSTGLIPTVQTPDTHTFDEAYNMLVAFCKKNNIDLEENNSSVEW